MEYISAREAAEKWGISQRRVAILCTEGRIDGAQLVGNSWAIPISAEKPTDARSLRYSETSAKDAHPFLKWAGGKGQLLSELERYYSFDSKITKYAEPFVGGGAVLFDILNRYELSEVYISDQNRDLINAYTVVRDNIAELIETLRIFQSEYIPLDDENRRAYYLSKRQRYNDIIKRFDNEVAVEKAALLIFLNKTCFNGLYRVNGKGLFNVPVGAYKKPLICDEDNLRAVSSRLQNVIIHCGDFEDAANFIDEHTFAYFDPPYRPLNATSGFTSYTENDFDDNEQIRLSEFVRAMSERGAVVTVSNSDPKNVNPEDDFFENVYSNFNIERVCATRMINSKSAGRGKINELIISNYGKRSKEMKGRVFDNWLSGFRDSIADYGYYTDFEKVYRNVDDIKVELNILNSLIGEADIEAKFEFVIKKYPETLKCIPILLAVRANEIYAIDRDGEYTYKFSRQNLPVDQYKVFMRKTGLFDLMQKHIINNLVDYVTGVETGLDSNGRKNRGGHLMENLVESYIQKAGFKKGSTYFKEMYISQITEKWGVDLSALSNSGKTEKRFDFVIRTETMIYGIETNFYGSGGSKLNETARSYKTLALETETIDGFTFVWFTDGKGWTSAKHNLEETFEIMDNIYNIDDLENGIIEKALI